MSRDRPLPPPVPDAIRGTDIGNSLEEYRNRAIQRGTRQRQLERALEKGREHSTIFSSPRMQPQAGGGYHDGDDEAELPSFRAEKSVPSRQNIPKNAKPTRQISAINKRAIKHGITFPTSAASIPTSESWHDPPLPPPTKSGRQPMPSKKARENLKMVEKKRRSQRKKNILMEKIGQSRALTASWAAAKRSGGILA
ncbi:hypothetical protein BJ508DRAFT_328122 [Ascobolus immersus RN42]|uniref:Uncharacterized protein n=1 Tax=Ascobolus immersus RN42 TaxID=1160509 RepID=A0A3N4I6F9_ASCIM|nr:hypothetical protein BJ508DRAFT_328122 [Ascobolus immersus RN42]